MTKQFITLALQPGGREYTYHNDEATTIRPGQMVSVVTPAGATLECEVLTATDDDSNPPSFPTKPCLRIA